MANAPVLDEITMLMGKQTQLKIFCPYCKGTPLIKVKEASPLTFEFNCQQCGKEEFPAYKKIKDDWKKSISSKPLKCSCGVEKSEGYCFDCKKPICNKCKGDHANHYSAFNKDLIKSSTLDSLIKQADKCRKEFVDFGDRLLNEIRRITKEVENVVKDNKAANDAILDFFKGLKASYVESNYFTIANIIANIKPDGVHVDCLRDNRNFDFEEIMKYKEYLKKHYILNMRGIQLEGSLAKTKNFTKDLPEEIENFKIISRTREPFLKLGILSEDKRLVAARFDQSIDVFDSFHNTPETSILLDDMVGDFSTYTNNRVISGTFSGSVYVHTITNNDKTFTQDLYKNGAHGNQITRVLGLPGNKFASAGKDGKIKIWDIKSRNIIKDIDIKTEQIYIISMLLLSNQTEFVTVSVKCKVQFWSEDKYDVKGSIDGIPLGGGNALIEYDGKLICGSYAKIDFHLEDKPESIEKARKTVDNSNIFIVDIAKRQIIKTIPTNVPHGVSCFTFLRNGIILFGTIKQDSLNESEGGFFVLNISDQTVKALDDKNKILPHNGLGIYSMFRYNDYSFITTGIDSTIEFWKWE